MPTYKIVLFVAAALLAVWVSGVPAAPASPASHASPAATNVTKALPIGYANRTKLAPLAGSGTQPNGFWDIPGSIVAVVQEVMGKCVYGNNCGGGCSSVINYGGSTDPRWYSLKPSRYWKRGDDLDSSCFDHDVCLFNSRFRSLTYCGRGPINPSLRTPNVNCDYWLYLDAKRIYDNWYGLAWQMLSKPILTYSSISCSYFGTWCWWTRKPSKAKAIANGMVAKLRCAGYDFSWV